MQTQAHNLDYQGDLFAKPSPVQAEENLITEFISASNNLDSICQLLMPMLSAISYDNNNRWLTWIGPFRLNKQLARRYKLHTLHTRQISYRSGEDNFTSMYNALRNGTSEFVVGYQTSAPSEKQLQLLQAAAKQGNSRGMIIRQRRVAD